MNMELLELFKQYGVGRRKLGDELFIKDKPPPRLGVYDVDDEELCHSIIQTSCAVPGCKYTTDSLLDFENHYNATHRYSCSQCKKVLPSPHLLDLHVQEKHDSFFAVMALKKPSYCCYIEDCKEKFQNADDRMDHCTKVHKLPKDFRYHQKSQKKNKKPDSSMDIDNEQTSQKEKKFRFNNSKQKGFIKFTGNKFTKDVQNSTASINMDAAMADLKESLPS
ncbi:unnamed protein product [Danaus chrysippus]|uniref:(African queen) hypothetical protein n=1 Tax=Danaus chrysippus TaxID=151541 RepID=A0A8J2QBY2_9NEOP|nr:unnamed protein product [Danaus chrysippus]